MGGNKLEFLLYLSTAGRDIYSLISKRVRVVENAPICRKHEVYGWYDSEIRTMIFCTDMIVNGPNPHYYVNETLFHEATHIAQSCKNDMGWVSPFWISKKQMPINHSRKVDLQTVKKLVGDNVEHLEHEAYWMEDKPEKVKYVLSKYCF